MTRVARSRSVPLPQLSNEERAALDAKLVDIFLASFTGPSRAEVIEHFIYRGPELELRLLYDADDEVIGFSSASITRYRIDGQDHDVLDGGFYTLPHVKGGGAVGLRGVFFHALRHMLRHRRASMSSVGLTLTPAGYRRLIRTLPGFHPRPGLPVPLEVDELMSAVVRHKPLQPVGDDPWVVRRTTLSVLPRDPERLADSKRWAEDPDARYYIERNPGYLQGDALMTYFALNLRNAVTTAARVIRGL